MLQFYGVVSLILGCFCFLFLQHEEVAPRKVETKLELNKKLLKTTTTNNNYYTLFKIAVRRSCCLFVVLSRIVSLLRRTGTPYSVSFYFGGAFCLANFLSDMSMLCTTMTACRMINIKWEVHQNV